MIMDKSNSGMMNQEQHIPNGGGSTGSQPHTNLDELFALLRNEIPEGRQTLLDTQSNLEKVADYCATAYLDTKDKKSAFEKTKNYTTHSLASVAYQVNTLAYNILHMLELQTNQISEMESQVNYISQKVDFHKEKVARREIALLTSAKTTARQPKVLIPANEEKQGKYIRKPIDFSILDDIGHGVKVVNNPSLFRTTSNSSAGGAGRMSGIQTLGPKSSMSSLSHYHHYNTLGGSGPAPTTKPPTPPQAVRSGFGTLTRSQNKEYRALAPPIAPPQVPKNYEANYPLGHPKNPMTQRQSAQGGNYSTLPMHAGGQQQVAGAHPHSQPQSQYMPGMAALSHNSHYGPGAMSSASLNSANSSASQYGTSMMNHMSHIHQMANVANTSTPPPPPPPQGNLSGSSIGNDSLPEPPPHLQSAHPHVVHSNYDNNRISTASPPLPPPPPPHGEDHELMHRVPMMTNNNPNAIYGTRPNPNSVPQNYVEKVIAIYDYCADKDDELTFKENSVIYVTRKNDDGWYEGELNGVTGLFPGNYVEPCL